MTLAVDNTPAVATPGLSFVRCNVPDLIGAINDANSGGPSVIQLSPDCSYVLTAESETGLGLPAITGDVTLRGAGETRILRDPTAPQFRILQVNNGTTLKATGLTIENGLTTGFGGGILNNGQLELHRVGFDGNAAANGGGLAVSAGASADIYNSIFFANQTTSVGGGAIMNFGTLNLIFSRVMRNSAPLNGGGVNTQYSAVTTIYGSTITDNVSTGPGGGISNLGETSINWSRVTRNTGSAGEGLASANENVTIRQSSIQNNIPDDCNPSDLPACVDNGSAGLPTLAGQFQILSSSDGVESIQAGSSGN